MGALWKNFIVSERKKKIQYENAFKDTFFGEMLRKPK
jgi:hypothetical protein